MKEMAGEKGKNKDKECCDLENAKLEAMRIRFRRVLGEATPAHVIRRVRKNIAKCVISSELRGKNA